MPRTGSTTYVHHLNAAFGPHLTQIGPQHATAAQLRDEWDPGWGCEWEELPTFGFIRNPWDWLVSVYNSGVSVTAGPPELWPGAPVEPPDAPGAHPGERMNAPFDEWARQRLTTPMDWLADADGLIVTHVWRFEDMIQRTDIVKSDMPHRPYREWYTPDLAACVAEKCRREVEIGRYVF